VLEDEAESASTGQRLQRLAMNGARLVYGMLDRRPPHRARDWFARNFWKSALPMAGRHSVFPQTETTGLDRLFGNPIATIRRPYHFFDIMDPQVLAFQFNRPGTNPWRETLEDLIISNVCAMPPASIFRHAINVRTCKIRVVIKKENLGRGVLASGLPAASFHAV